MSRKLSLEEITERGILVPGQEYVQDYLARSTDMRIGIYEHSRATSTCEEKTELLNQESGQTWTVEQTVKAMFYQSKAGMLYGFITPELGVLIKPHKHFGRQMGPARPLPEYMEQGTCTPFIPDTDISRAAGQVQRLYVHYDPLRAKQLVDISIGGRGSDAHKRSLWMPYGTLVMLLVKQFGTMVSLARLDYAVRSKSFKPKPDEVRSYGR